MKHILVGIVILFGQQFARASCNVNLAIAAAAYLTELEKAKLYDQQAGSPCQMLDSEYKKCTPPQKNKLGKVLDLKTVLGNICMPHLPPPPTAAGGEGTLKNPYDWMRKNTEAEVSGMTRIFVDLNSDGTKELLVAPNSVLGNGGGPFTIFEKQKDGYRVAGGIGIHPKGFQVLMNKLNGFADIKAYWHLSAFDGDLLIYEYNGTEYVEKSRRKIKSAQYDKEIKPTEATAERTEDPNSWNL